MAYKHDERIFFGFVKTIKFDAAYSSLNVSVGAKMYEVKNSIRVLVGGDGVECSTIDATVFVVLDRDAYMKLVRRQSPQIKQTEHSNIREVDVICIFHTDPLF